MDNHSTLDHLIRTINNTHQARRLQKLNNVDFYLLAFTKGHINTKIYATFNITGSTKMFIRLNGIKTIRFFVIVPIKKVIVKN